MLNKVVVSILIMLYASAAYSESTSPTDNIVGPTLEQAGWSNEYFSDSGSVNDLLAAEMLVKNERLSRDGVERIEISQKFMDALPTGADAMPATKTVFETMSVPGIGPNGSTVKLLRVMNPEEVARLRGETIAPSEVMAVGLQAYGEGALLLGAGLQGMVNESAIGQAIGGSALGQGFGTNLSNEDMTAMVGMFASNPYLCLGHMMTNQTIDQDNGGGDDVYIPMIKPWESASPFYFMMGPACFALAMADRLGVDLDESAKALLEAQQAASAAAVFTGPDKVTLNGRTAYRIDATGLNLTQSAAGPDQPRPEPVQYASLWPNDDSGSTYDRYARSPPKSYGVPGPSMGYAPKGTLQASGSSTTASSNSGATRMTITAMSIWIDTEFFVRLKVRLEGTMQQSGEPRDIFMEREFKDYKTVPGSHQYEPYRETLRMGGVLGPEEQAEMQGALKELEEFDRQMASMPPDQRAMMERMMGDKMQQMRNMANGGAVEFELITTGIVINPDFSAPETGMAAMMEPNLVQIIQRHLVALGYDPGNTTGDLTKQTVVAITKFEAAKGMPVTGQATPQLAGVLAAAVDANK